SATPPPPRRPRDPLSPCTTLFRSGRRPCAERDRQGTAQRRHGPLRVRLDDEEEGVDADPRREADEERGHARAVRPGRGHRVGVEDRKSTRLNSSHVKISYAVVRLK